MSATATQPDAPITQAVRLLGHVLLCQAAELARNGDYDAAEQLLRTSDSADRNPAALDLLARIRAQQGRLLEAAAFWEQSLRLAPRSPGAEAALSRLRQMQRHPIWIRLLAPACYAFLTLGFLTFALFWGARRQDAANGRLRRDVASASQRQSASLSQDLAALQTQIQILNSNQVAAAHNQAEANAGLARLSQLDAQVARLASAQETSRASLESAKTDVASFAENQQSLITILSNRIASSEHTLGQTFHQAMTQALPPPTKDPSFASPSPAFGIQIPGLKASTNENALVLVFEDGIFDHGTHFRTGAKATIQAASKSLAQNPTPLHIEVVGCADDDRAFRQWTAQYEYTLALERATAVVDYIIELGQFRPDNLTARPSSPENRPFPSDSPKNRSRNRTVVLRITQQPK